MAPRANWKGYLKLSLVSCPVALYPAASTSERVSFHMLNKATGHRLKQQYVDSETGVLVEPEERVRGYAVAKDDYVVVEDAELDDLEIESTHTIDIDRFVPRAEIDQVFLDNRYYIAPDDQVGEEAFAVIREAMRRRDMVGLAKVVLFRRERVIMLEPRAKGLIGTVLRYDYEVRDDKAYFEEIPPVVIAKEMLDLASYIIDTKAAHFDPTQFKDRYQDAVVEFIRAKRAGRPVAPPHEAKPTNVVNLMEALRRSIAAEIAPKPAIAAPAERAPATKPTTARRAPAKAPKPRRKAS